MVEILVSITYGYFIVILATLYGTRLVKQDIVSNSAKSASF